jgi:DNA-directed RNA polymerase subunit RPC12/RpoP
MNKEGMNETKREYVCTRCEDFVFYTRQIGHEEMPSKRRIFCNRCKDFTNFKLVPLEKKAGK